jgi:hypothetical protein
MPCKPVLASLFNSLRGAPRLADGCPQVHRQSRGRVMAATLSPALVILSASMLLSGAQAKSLHPDYQLMRGEVQRYGDWLVGCDNQAACAMLGFPSMLPGRERDPLVTDMALQISLSGPLEDISPVVEILPFGVEAGRSGFGALSRPFFLNVEYDVAAFSLQHGFSRTTLIPMEAKAVLRHLGDGKPLLGKTLSEPRQSIRFPQLDFNRAYRAMLTRRTELLEQITDQAIDNLPGELLDGTTMPTPRPHRRITAMPHIVAGFVPIFVHSLCRHSFMQDLRYYRFDDGALLWSYSCDDGSASWQSRTYWEMAPAGPMVLANPLVLPEPRETQVDAGQRGLDNAVFDWDFGILREYRYQDGREDCGTFRAWGYTNNGWQLLERREMPTCKGLEPSEWIRTHFMPTDGAGPDE